MHSQYIIQLEPEDEAPKYKDESTITLDEIEQEFHEITNDDPYVEDPIIHRRSSRWNRMLSAVATIIYEASQSFVYSAAFLPVNDYDNGIGIISGYLTTPLCEAVNQLVSKNQDVRAILRVQHKLYDGNAVLGCAKIIGKHIVSPIIPVIIAVYGTDDPAKDFEHSFIHAALHATLGYSIYKLSSTLANKIWPLKEIELKALSPKAQFVQDYIAAPILAGFPRMVLMAEFLRKTGFGIFQWIDNQNLHAPLVFGSSYFIYHFWRRSTRESRKVQPYVKLDKGITGHNIDVKAGISISNKMSLSSENKGNEVTLSKKEILVEQMLSSEKAMDEQVQSAKNSADDQVLEKSITQKMIHLAKGSLKIVPIFLGGACGNYLYSQIIGTTHDDLLLERTQRDLFVALGMYTAWGSIKLVEKTATIISKNYSSFFYRSEVVESNGDTLTEGDSHTLKQNFIGRS